MSSVLQQKKELKNTSHEFESLRAYHEEIL